MPRGRPRKSDDDVLLKSADLLGWALGGLEREIAQTRERLTALTTQATKLRERLGRSGAGRRIAGVASAGETAPARESPKGRRKMSPEARRRISEMMKKRWAERRKRNT
jgi:hypothetical protein